jgi:hypothetical protein
MKIPQKYKLMILILGVGLLLAGAAGVSLAGLDMVNPVYLPITFNDLIKGFTNPGFEYGAEGWLVQSNQGDDVVTTTAAHSGQWSAGLGNGTSSRLASISQQVNVPQQAYVATYFQRIDSQESCPGNNRVMVYINDQPYQHYNFCQDSNNGEWENKKIYLAPYKGQTVVFKLEFKSSTILNNFLYVDDFYFELP